MKVGKQRVDGRGKTSSGYKWKQHLDSVFTEEMSWRRDVQWYDFSTDVANETIITAMSQVAESLGMRKFSYVEKLKKPWFNKNCYEQKRKVKASLKNCFKSNFCPRDSNIYKEEKKIYRNLLTKNKKDFENSINKDISNSKNPTAFWKAVNTLKFRTPGLVHIKMEVWNEFLSQMYPPRINFNDRLTDVRHPILDVDITYEELIMTLKKCKNGKAAGPDGFSYEFFKNLPSNRLLFVQCLFNKVLQSELVPAEWSRTHAFMIHKKGKKSDPSNYRCIALMNSIPKIFTQILNNRLNTWAEQSEILPEFQSGFRCKRSCLDVFTLNSIIQIHSSRDRGKLYAFFVNFENAFPSINHSKLWSKLFKIGVSSKMIRLCKNLYEQASVAIRTREGVSNSTEVTKGLLQGDTLSPSCFSIYISDMEIYFYDQGSRGVPIDKSNEIIILAYADDLVILADSVSDLKRKIKILSKYCEKNDLTVNVNKSKIVVFQKGGRRKNVTFFYNKKMLEVVSTYVYIGAEFSNSGTFFNNTNRMTATAKMAMESVLNILKRAKSNVWETKNVLFDSMVRSIVVYNAEVWGLRYLDDIEKIYSKFFKRVLALPTSTPNYAMRIESNRIKLSYVILKSALNWIEKK